MYLFTHQARYPLASLALLLSGMSCSHRLSPARTREHIIEARSEAQQTFAQHHEQHGRDSLSIDLTETIALLPDGDSLVASPRPRRIIRQLRGHLTRHHLQEDSTTTMLHTRDSLQSQQRERQQVLPAASAPSASPLRPFLLGCGFTLFVLALIALRYYLRLHR